MIYRNRAQRAVLAIICGWIALRLILLWPTLFGVGPTPPPAVVATGTLVSAARQPVASVASTRHSPKLMRQAARSQILNLSAPPAIQEMTTTARRLTDMASLPGGAASADRVGGTAVAAAAGVAIGESTSRASASPASTNASFEAVRPNRGAAHADLPSPRAPSPRLSLSAWSIVRPSGKARALATSGALGASQVGARARVDLIEPAVGVVVAANLRLSTALPSASGREAGVGISLRPRRGIPVELIAEARIAPDAGDRDRLALLVAGGLSDQRLPLGFRLSAYAQAGLVGIRQPDAFIDGAASVERAITNRFPRSAKLGPAAGRHTISVGLAVAGGAQPGAVRLDVGPELSLNQPLIHGGLRLTGGYRWRVAGDARPGSGPALTIGINF